MKVFLNFSFKSSSLVPKGQVSLSTFFHNFFGIQSPIIQEYGPLMEYHYSGFQNLQESLSQDNLI